MKTAFDGLLSLADAAEVFGRDASTIRQGIHRGKFQKDVDAKLFGKQWVITYDSLVREYGQPKKKD